MRRPSTGVERLLARYTPDRLKFMEMAAQMFADGSVPDLERFVNWPTVARFLPIREYAAGDREAAAVVMLAWATVRWMGLARPLYLLDDSLGASLAQSLPPEGLTLNDLILPSEAFYIQVEGRDFESGRHHFEGFNGSRFDGFLVAPSGVGPLMVTGFSRRNAAQFVYDIVDASRDLREAVQRPRALTGFGLVINFLIAWSETRALDGRTVSPSGRIGKKKADRDRRQGRSRHPFSIVSLSRRAAERLTVGGLAVAAPITGAPRRRHICAMHFRRYWLRPENVRDDDKVTAEKDGAKGRLCRVTRLVAPHWRGSGEVAPKTVKVVS